jgi:hypothetical protein
MNTLLIQYEYFIYSVSNFTWALNLGCDNQAAEEAIFKVQRGVQTQKDLNETPGGSTAFHKCVTQLLSWHPNKDMFEIE